MDDKKAAFDEKSINNGYPMILPLYITRQYIFRVDIEGNKISVYLAEVVYTRLRILITT